MDDDADAAAIFARKQGHGGPYVPPCGRRSDSVTL
jgi:hypothetical protein